MYLAKIFIGFLTVQFFFTWSVRAEEEESHGQAGTAGAVENYSGKQSLDWVEVQKKLAELKGKLDSQSNVVEGLILARAQAPAKEKVKRSEEIEVEHRKLQKLTEDYNQRSVEYETKYPEKGVKGVRTYQRLDTKSIDAMENDMTLDGRLSKLHNKVIHQYPHATKNKNSKKSVTKERKEKGEPVIVEKDVTDQIILQK